MSATKTLKDVASQKPRQGASGAPLLSRAMDFISSVKFGVVLLCLLVVLSIIGMLIVQQNVNGFDAFYAGLTPAEKTVFGALGFFDIYHSFYFNLLLLVLSLNIVLASIDRFPTAWAYIVRPKLTGSRKWLENRDQTSVVNLSSSSLEDSAKALSAAMTKRGFKTTETEKDGGLFVFGETGKWNRIGAYLVHVCLLTLFLGHFIALQTGFDADVGFQPGQTTNEIELIEFDLDKQNRFSAALPFSITCDDIQQKLIDPNGSIETFNTLDWVTSITINDPEYGVTSVDVGLNRPFSYRGYRFFQAQTVPIGNARTISLQLVPESGSSSPAVVNIKRNGSTTLEDGTLVKYIEFLPDFTFNSEGQPDTRSSDYNNPAAVLTVTPKGEQPVRIFAFAGNIADDIPVGAPKAGYKWKLQSFEKSPRAHILSIKYDPYNGAFIAWYFGGIGLIGALSFVFFFSHRRVWGLLSETENGCEIVLAGEANRNHQAFEERFEKLTSDLAQTSADYADKG